MTLYGANVGGYAAAGEPPQQAFNRILTGFGQIGIVRWWPNRFFRWSEVPAFYGTRPLCADLGSDVAGLLAGKYDDPLRDICTGADRRTLLTFAHEPEDDVAQGAFSIRQWQMAHQQIARIIAEVANPRVSFGPLLMGVSYHPTRYKAAAPGNVPWTVWLDFPLKGIRWLGADLYQWGKDDATADKASAVISPFFDACATKGKRAVIGELGTRRVTPQYIPGITDAARARYLTDAVALFDAAGKNLTAVMYYESDRGAADKVPWLLLNNAAGNGVKSPKAAAVWRAVSSR